MAVFPSMLILNDLVILTSPHHKLSLSHSLTILEEKLCIIEFLVDSSDLKAK